jgi:Mg/Co/Ni transporter MgtE
MRPRAAMRVTGDNGDGFVVGIVVGTIVGGRVVITGVVAGMVVGVVVTGADTLNVFTPIYPFESLKVTS